MSLRILHKDRVCSLTVYGFCSSIRGVHQARIELVNVLVFIPGTLSKDNLVRTHCGLKGRGLRGRVKTDHPSPFQGGAPVFRDLGAGSAEES